MTRRLLPAALLLLAVPAPAHAIPITGYAVGTIAENHSGPPNSTARIFAVGSTFSVSFTYDLDPNPNLFIGIEVRGPDGFELSIAPNPVALGTLATVQAYEPEDWLRIDFSHGPQIVSVRLILDGDAGSLLYARDRGSPHEGFLATLVRASAPVPEPSGLALGLLGAVLAGLYRRGEVDRDGR